jgi:hypothetical protein
VANTVREIVDEWLRDNGYDGLAGDDCGCIVGDLFPCESCDARTCVAGHWDEASGAVRPGKLEAQHG